MKSAPHFYKKDVLILILNDEPWKEVHTSIFGKRPKVELFKDLANIESQFLQLEYKSAKSFILKKLARRGYTSYELLKILKERLVSKKIAEMLVEEFQKLGYIEDSDWIKSYIIRQKEKKQGPISIKMKLKAKGVPEEEIQKALELTEEELPQSECIQNCLKSKYKNLNLKDLKDRKRVIGGLVRRGFSYEEIRNALEDQE